MLRFYGHFAAAYGTFWLVMLLMALVSQSHIDAGMFGMCGFPILAIIYAAIRTFSVTTGTPPFEDEDLRTLRSIDDALADRIARRLSQH